jgi:hypothetical protein
MQSGPLTLGDQFVTRVTIVGAATGSAQLREGIVTNIRQNVRVPEIRNEVFEDQILVLSEDNSRIICPGDSGSVLIKRINDANGVTNLIVGLAFASVEGGAGLVANHIHHVSTSLLGIGFED